MLKILSIILLMPFSLIYGFVIISRNTLFTLGILKEYTFDIPVINVGNITVGGTGKTPHVEYLIQLLKDQNPAVLSRGYKRKTKGFVLANSTSTAAEIGDEPAQIKNKFPEITVAVDENRVNGINQLIKNTQPGIVILDDAYQHRYVKPKINILLVDYNRPLFTDFVFPGGRLREPALGKKRADIIIVTKCPDDFTENQKKQFIKKLKPKTSQQVFFSTFQYGTITPVFENSNTNNIEAEEVLAFAGIARPENFFKHLDERYLVTSVPFPDHHFFTETDLDLITEKYNFLNSAKKIIVTTEKDATRIKTLHINTEIKKVLYYIPITVKIIFNEQAGLENYLKKTLLN